ncbi:MAG: ROK family protein [Phycisphaeraceae bacterium JB051]
MTISTPSNLPLAPRLSLEMDLIRKATRCSRSDLHRLMNCRKNTIGSDVASLIDDGLLRETQSNPLPRGRPSVHLEIDTQSRHVLGLAILPGKISCGRYNLLGKPFDCPQSVEVSDPKDILTATRKLIRQNQDNQTLMTGISIPGMFDQQRRNVLSSSAWPDGEKVSLQSLAKLTENRIVVDNTTNALGTRWLLEHAEVPRHDHLLILLSDGLLGATFLINGRPIPGCIVCSNELGHTRLPVETPRCYCGQTGCLERIFSTEYFKQLGGQGKLSSALIQNTLKKPAEKITTYLSMGLANATNFCRPTHLTIMTDLPNMQPYLNMLMNLIKKQILSEFANHIQMHHWIEPGIHPSASGAALALSTIYLNHCELPPQT